MVFQDFSFCSLPDSALSGLPAGAQIMLFLLLLLQAGLLSGQYVVEFGVQQL